MLTVIVCGVTVNRLEQRLLAETELTYKKALIVYIDDILVTGAAEKEHLETWRYEIVTIQMFISLTLC